MATELGVAYLSISASTGDFGKDVKKALGDVEGEAEKTGKSAGSKLGKAIAVGMAAAAAAAVVVGKKLISAGENASTSNARIEQIATSMGLFGAETGNVTARLVDLANETARATGVDQNQIKGTQAKLLTFKELAATADEVGGSFDRATIAAVDLAAAGMGSAESNAIQLGKALNDPIKGISALNRVGLTFTEEQQNQIRAMQESGDMAGAQNVILEALETQVGGTAAATANASDRMKVAWSQVQENLGLKVLPMFERFSDWFIDTGMPALERFGDKVGAYLGPIMQDLGRVFTDRVLPVLQDIGGYVTGTVVPALREFGGWVQRNGDWLRALAVVVGVIVVGIQAYVKILALWRAVTVAAAAAQAFFNAVLSANPIGLIILAVVALVAGLVYFFTKTETGRKIVEKVWGAIKKAMTAVTDWWTKTALPALKNGWDQIVGFFKGGRDKVKQFLEAALDVIKKVWSYSPIGLITSNWDKIMGFFKGIPGKVKAEFDRAINFIKNIWKYTPIGLITGNWDKIVNFFKNIPSRIKSAFGNAANILKDVGRKIIQGLLDGLTAGFQKVRDTLSDLTSKLPDWKGPERVDKKILKKPAQHIMAGFTEGLESQYGNVRSTLQGLTADIPTTVRANANPVSSGVDGSRPGVVQYITNNYPVAEKTSVSANRSLQYAAAIGV